MSKVNWIDAYSDKGVQRFQAGGPMAAPQGPDQAPDLEGMLMEYAQTKDPQLAVVICDMLVEMMAAQQGAAPAMPAEQVPAPPMARRGIRTSNAPVF